MRLIDADAFERSVMFGDAEDMQDVIYALREYPTAYDPDKVVEQLENDAIPVLDEDEHIIPESNIKEDCEIAMVALSDAIKIVKAGGVDEL